MTGVLSATGASTSSVALATAVGAAAISLLVAIGTQVTLSVRESHARRYERRRAALVDAQNAGVTLRGRLRDYGLVSRADAGRPSAELGQAERRYDDARALLDVTLSRVEDRFVVAATRSWLSAAEVSFISSSEVPAAREQQSWDAVNAAIGSALQSKNGTAGRR